MESTSVTFEGTFDSNLITILSSYLVCEDYMNLLSSSKQFTKYQTSGEIDYIWRGQFEAEFFHT